MKCVRPTSALSLTVSKWWILRFRVKKSLKVTGNSWFWSFEYPDLGVQVVSNLLPQEDAEAQGRPWLLAVDNALYVPTDTTVRVLVTSNDVIHSFAVPSFGVKEDAIQGRVNETWFKVEREGM